MCFQTQFFDYPLLSAIFLPYETCDGAVTIPYRPEHTAWTTLATHNGRQP